MNLTALHLFSLILTIPVILYADHIGFKYFTGKIKTVDEKKIKIAHTLVTLGLTILIITGILITIPMWAVMLENPIFYAKMAFVVTLFVNGIFIGKLMKKATTTPFENLSKDEKIFLIISGGVSIAGWIFSTLIGFFAI